MSLPSAEFASFMQAGERGLFLVLPAWNGEDDADTRIVG
jgi:hypothetical protein